IGNTPETLRALVANDDRARLARVAAIVSGLGFDVVAEEVDGVAAAATAVRTNPDLAIVALGSDPEHAFELIQRIAREGACPGIALLDATNEGFVREAARRGIFAYIDSDSPERWRSAIEIVLRRFTDYENLKG